MLVTGALSVGKPVIFNGGLNNSLNEPPPVVPVVAVAITVLVVAAAVAAGWIGEAEVVPLLVADAPIVDVPSEIVAGAIALVPVALSTGTLEVAGILSPIAVGVVENVAAVLPVPLLLPIWCCIKVWNIAESVAICWLCWATVRLILLLLLLSPPPGVTPCEGVAGAEGGLDLLSPPVLILGGMIND